MQDGGQKDLLCDYCGKNLHLPELYIIYQLGAETDTKIPNIGLQRILEDLGDYAMKKGYHISASQIFMLRPDIMKEYLTESLKDKVELCYLETKLICYACYEEEYIKLVPAI